MGWWAIKNTERLLSRIMTIVYGKELERFTLAPRRFGFIGDIALAVYLVVLAASIYYIVLVLAHFGFHVVDIGFFILFFALILYFAFRIRYGAQRMELTGKKEGFFRSLLELSALPIVSVGRFLVTRFERLNFIAMFMDFFVELPLKLLLEFFDTFSRVLKEKKDEIYS